MQLFYTQNNTLTPLSETPFLLEKDIQALCEQNLSQISELVFVKSEFSIKNKRIDTLAHDPENNSFVIIEYKRNKNYSVVDQGVSYLNLMLEYKAEFIIEYNESLNQNLKRDDVDWSQSKIVFVAPSFTDDQKQSTNFKDFAIELWEIKRFNDIIIINPIRKSKSAPSIKQIKPKEISDDNELINIIKEVKTYDEEYHLENKYDDVKELYQEFRTAILDLADNIEIKTTKVYIGFKTKNNICSIAILKNELKLWINAKYGDLKDEKGLSRDVSNIGHHGLGDYELKISNNQNKEYVMSLIRQVI
ncbi:MAG: DUF5655 domain-containing protein [Moraxella sp.]|uniref:DUF5655 domain-containing protein n=1 Tax=Moraxella sp. TaxID=479 RepID=UPI0026DB15FD|nr:DUF5655 domain-containing protein [Moraxella sp.]MDO4450164.1 DUF5655 domain-containing protein [Moraxella sp.]